MKSLICMFRVTIVFGLACFSATADKHNIAINKYVINCIEKFGDNNDECLEDISDKSGETLKQAYENKLLELQSFDYTWWWMGSEDQKKNMISTFKSRQKTWLAYRTEYCQSALAGAQGTHELGTTSTACKINMNLHRVAGINLLKAELTD